jgi:hypothetical protein
MRVVILNWKNGENDPFTAYNYALTCYLEACGKCTKIVQLTDSDWPNQILKLKEDGIDFVFTWQGLGTDLVVGEQHQSFWDIVQVPLITLHFDHPCHMPTNHAFERRYCAHIYSTREFSHYASRFFRTQTRAIYIEPPLFNLDAPGDYHGADCFVLAKNITPPPATEARWKVEYDERLFGFCMIAAETLKQRLNTDGYIDVHSIVDQLISNQGHDEFYANIEPALYHGIHSQLDFYMRNVKAANVLSLLKDFPLHIFGRGWEFYAKESNQNHQFFDGLKVADSQQLYYSKYGIVDIAPSLTGLHDRTFRAMRNNTPFLNSGYLPEFLPNMSNYDPLFYSFNSNDLPNKCEHVISNPEAHADLASEFGYLYQMRCQPSEFIWKLDSIARSLDHR